MGSPVCDLPLVKTMDEIHDLVAAYAVDALDDPERAEYEAHLADCADCQEELATLSEAAASLAETVSVTPSPDLKERVMTAIATGHPAEVIALDSRRRKPMGWGLVAVAASVLVVSVGLIVSNIGGQDGDISGVLAAPDAVEVDLDSTVGAARFVYSESLGQGVFTGSDLDLPEEDRVYELWLIDDDGPAAAGAFRPESPEQATVLVEGIEPGLTLAMTEEPEAGLPEPTGEVLLSAEI
jgi:Anti-sigma-K factor rskA/Putative zinc-finger